MGKDGTQNRVSLSRENTKREGQGAYKSVELSQLVAEAWELVFYLGWFVLEVFRKEGILTNCYV
jgi:hypothetical protein